MKTEKQIAEKIKELSEKMVKAENKATKMSIQIMIKNLYWVLENE